MQNKQPRDWTKIGAIAQIVGVITSNLIGVATMGLMWWLETRKPALVQATKITVLKPTGTPPMTLIAPWMPLLIAGTIIANGLLLFLGMRSRNNRQRSETPPGSSSVLTLQVARAELSSDPNIRYRTRLEMILTNHTSDAMAIWTPTWESKDVRCQEPYGAGLRLEGVPPDSGGWRAGAWHDEQQCISVEPGRTFLCWIGLLEPQGEGLERRLQLHTTGTATFPAKIQGKLQPQTFRL